ncbi:integrase [Legionella sainthelensi]|uniref:Integrase n=1 Tax=Legionella sainthelensi TaxID=28087 RepID=A0A0W0YDK3_9GAMM|nr:integrase [Legionella sainthelensi]VEH36845.1 integrase [Legionella sainthelensi]
MPQPFVTWPNIKYLIWLRVVQKSFEDRQDLLGYRSGRITTHYSSAELQSLYQAANKVCENQKSGLMLTLLRNSKSRPAS